MGPWGTLSSQIQSLANDNAMKHQELRKYKKQELLVTFAANVETSLDASRSRKIKKNATNVEQTRQASRISSKARDMKYLKAQY